MQEEEEKQIQELHKMLWDWAMRYINAGISIVPLRLSDKRPAIEWVKYQTTVATEEEVAEWFSEGVPDGRGGRTKIFGLAIITGALSRIVVVDCDTADAEAYAITAAGFFSPISVKTTRGCHMYFAHPGYPVGNKAGGIGRDWPDVPGLDLRGDGGYVVAPPTIKFDAEGAFQHQYRWSVPAEEWDGVWPSLPTYRGVQKVASFVAPADSSEWDFSKLSLASVTTLSAPTWQEMSSKVLRMGRKMRDGDGRNPWMTKYAGECIAAGMSESESRDAANSFQAEFFDEHLSAVELETIIQSVITTDKRNHPERYAAEMGGLEESNPNVIRLISSSNVSELKGMSAGRQMLIDPFIPPNSIIQVVGFNGHGKSLWLLNMLWAAARGQSYASGVVDRPVRSLYMDYESSRTTLAQRVEDCEVIHGPMAKDFLLWGASVTDQDLSLADKSGKGYDAIEKLINEVKPELLIIDTVRQAWAGMDENSPHSWLAVNAFAMACRNSGISVILVHHRNKPNQNGHGREAGSTAQLKDLDVQIFVTKVVEDLDQAKKEAALPDQATSVIDFRGNSRTAWSYLRLYLSKEFKLRVVFEITFGKVRQSTENHVPTYVGMAQSVKDGKWQVVSSLTPRQKAVAMMRNGAGIEEICDAIGATQPAVQEWIK